MSGGLWCPACERVHDSQESRPVDAIREALKSASWDTRLRDPDAFAPFVTAALHRAGWTVTGRLDP